MISVCIATFNGEKFIKEQIKSILEQTEQVDEIIISDDNSTDRTLEIIKEFNDKRIKILKNKTKGIISNFETALENVKGEYIFIADQDDIWIENKVELTLKILKEYDLVIHDAELIDSDKNKIGNKTYFQIINSKKGILRNIYKCRYLGCCMAFNRKVLNKALGFSRKNIMHDIWIGLVAEKYGKVYFYDKCLIKYRRHGNNLSFASEKSKRSLKEKIRDRYNLVRNIIQL